MEPKTIALPRSVLFSFEIAIYAIAFTVPLLVAGPQWLTGTLVNYFLFMYALAFPKKNFVAIAVLPSIAALGHGVLFGPFTPFLIYFLPFIWIGNIVLIKVFLALNKKMNIPFAVFLSSFVKVLVLFLAASIYFQLNIVPRMFLSSMGIIQLYTALAGGIVALMTLKLIKKYE
jgi:hypothetical protein